jgi:hypothetical protein
MLVTREPKGALVDPRKCLEACFEDFAGFVLDTPVFDEHREVVLPVVPGLPAKFVDVALEFEGAGGFEPPAESFFDSSLERIKAHPVDGILESCVLYPPNQIKSLSLSQMETHLAVLPVPIIPLHDQHMPRDVQRLLGCTESNYICRTRVCLLVRVCHTHSSTYGDVEPDERAFGRGDGNEAEIIGKDVDIVIGWDRYCDFKLHGVSNE